MALRRDEVAGAGLLVLAGICLTGRRPRGRHGGARAG